MPQITPRLPAFLIFAFVFAIARAPAADDDRAPNAKPRVIATTDGEIDDRCSMIRFLLYTNEWDTEGLIYSSSKYHWKGDEDHNEHGWRGETWIQEQINKYEQCYPNLKANDPDFPAPDYLRDQVFVGNIAYEGAMERETPGSNRIVEVLLAPDPRPVWLQAWGGPNTIARALKTIEENHHDRIDEVAKKAKIFIISAQDNTVDRYILKNWPEITLIHSTAFPAIAYGWRDIMTPQEQEYFDADWMNANILKGHGPLCAAYEAHGDGSFRSEGDSPAFMHMIDVGLGSIVHPTWGGWGGRFYRAGDRWRSAPDDRDPYKAILRWAQAFQNDWAARADWCVRSYDGCNHNPIAVCNGDRTTDVLEVPADPGRNVRLSAIGSSDPDGDKLICKWWTYVEPGAYWAEAPIANSETPKAIVAVPRDAAGRTIHVILEITDDGDPPLTSYRRVILDISGQPAPPPPGARSGQAYLNAPITSLSGPSVGDKHWEFYRGINLNGPPIEIDGNQWEGDDAPNFICDERPLNSPGITLRPPTDDAREKMIHSFRWNTDVTIKVTNVPEAQYAVYAYLWEETSPETFSISLQGDVVERSYYSGVVGEWHRAGPWTTTVRDGTITIGAKGGAANFSGIEIWRAAE